MAKKIYTPKPSTPVQREPINHRVEFIKDNPYSEELSQDEIRSINDYLAENPNTDVKSVYNSVLNERGNRSNQEKIDNNKSYWSGTVPRNLEQMGSTIQEGAQMATHLIDLPRRSIAGSIDAIRAYSNNTKPEYNIKDYILSSGRAMPTLGTEFARSNPLSSGLIDIISPAIVMGGMNAAANLTRGVVQSGKHVFSQTPASYGNYKTVTHRASNNNASTYSGTGGSKLTGTTSSKGRHFNTTSKIGGGNTVGKASHYTETFFQPKTPVEPTFQYVNGGTWVGVPQYVEPIVQSAPVEAPRSNRRIVEETPVNVTFDQMVRESGARPGDTIVSKDGREWAYTVDSSGKKIVPGQNNFGNIRNIYDQNQNVRNQKIVVDSTSYNPKSKRDTVYTREGMSPEEAKRGTIYYPRPIN